MSYTEIYSISEEHCKKIGETQNGHRSAMYVWQNIAQKYFGLERFPYSDEKLQMKIWNANKHYQLTESEVIVLLSTMDDACVKKSDIPKLIKAFEEYHKEHPNSSFLEQAEIIKNTELLDDQKISWNQTSVNSYKYRPRTLSMDEYIEEFELDPEEREGIEEDEDIVIYKDISNLWDIFEQIEEGK